MELPTSRLSTFNIHALVHHENRRGPEDAEDRLDWRRISDEADNNLECPRKQRIYGVRGHESEYCNKCKDIFNKKKDQKLVSKEENKLLSV